MSMARSDNISINISEVKESKSVKKSCSFTSSLPAQDILSWGTWTYLFDATKDLISLTSSAANEFLTDTVPSWVSATFYIGPTVYLFLSNTVKKCRSKPQHSQEEDDDEVKSQLIRITEKNPLLKEQIEEHLEFAQELLKSVNEDQRVQNVEGVNVLINLIYLTFRLLRGALIVMQMHDLASKETNDKITSITDEVYYAGTILYSVAVLARHLSSGKKPRAPTSSPTFFKHKAKESKQEIELGESLLKNQI